MTAVAAPIVRPPIVYPESDGKPIAENTLQFEWIVTIKGGIGHLFADDPNVFVAGDLFWYPVEGRPDIRLAPDIMAAFGRPKGHRGSYRQWEEGGIAPQVVFEILSPGNRFGEMSGKFDFYREHGVEEYYIFDPGPARLELSGFSRRNNQLIEIAQMNGHVSPRLGIRFDLDDQRLRIIRPDGKPFATYEELARRADQERAGREQERQRAEQERQRAEQERHRADQAIEELERLRRQVRSGPE
jgi:Uma2 family endonuclease